MTTLPRVDADLTAKARIRNAALALYAANGEAGTTVREVAQAAGVTHGLVVHHFTNKQGLRAAVQQHVIDVLREAVSAVPNEGSAHQVRAARAASIARIWAEEPTFLPYVRRVLLHPSDDADDLIELFVELTVSQLRELRAAGITRRGTPENLQAFATIMGELGPRMLDPLAARVWSRLTDGSSEPPRLEVRADTADARRTD